MPIASRDGSSRAPDVPDGHDPRANLPGFSRNLAPRTAGIDNSKAPALARAAKLRVVGEVDSDGRHFLIVEASAVIPESALTARRAAASPLEAARVVSMPRVLTPRELQIAALVSNGHLNKQIAALLRISEYTVSTHIRRIFSKLSIKRRSMLASMYAMSASASRPESKREKKSAGTTR